MPQVLSEKDADRVMVAVDKGLEFLATWVNREGVFFDGSQPDGQFDRL